MAAQAIEFRGVPAVRWTSPGGDAAIATLQGAHLVSWIPAGGEEMLFLSERSAFEPGRAIRGGIPVCFPQFAERGPLVKHGFARTLPWRFEGIEEAGEGTRAAFSLASTPATLALWPHAFELELATSLAPGALHVELRVHNRGTEAFCFAAALHTYFLVGDAPRVQLRGWPEDVGFARPIDRVFTSMPHSVRLEEGGRAVGIEQHGFPDTVVWNPGAALAATMPDMSPDGWRRMVCIEAAAVEPPVLLQPGACWHGRQSIRAPRYNGRFPTTEAFMAHNAIGWFEIYVQDMPRARRFYETVLGRKLEKLEAGGLEMWSFAGDGQAPGSAGSLVHMPGVPSGGNSTIVYFVCEDCAVEEGRVKAAGGRVEKSKFSIGPYGFVSLVYDTEGNMFGLHSMK